jgi:hypothetical protein
MLAQRPEQARYAYRRLMFEAPALDEGVHFERGSDDDPRVLGDRQFMADIPRHMRVYRSSYSLDQVIDTVSTTLGVERSEVLSRSRQRRLSLARALITWYATERGVATLAEVARRLERDPSTLFVGVERYRTLRPELFNLTALPDNGPLLRQGPGSVPPGVTVPAGMTGSANGNGSGGALGSGGGIGSSNAVGSQREMASPGVTASLTGSASSGISHASGVSHVSGMSHASVGSHASGVSVSSGLTAASGVGLPPGVEEPPRGVGPALLSGAWVTRR